MKAILLSPAAKLPQRTNEFAAGYDLFAPVNFEVKPGRNLMPLDVSIELLPDTEAMVRPRSGFSIKGIEGYDPANPNILKRFDADVVIGTIDEDFRGSIGVIIKSYEKESFVIPAGTKVAQMVISHYVKEPFEFATQLSETERGVKGFGHTGSK